MKLSKSVKVCLKNTDIVSLNLAVTDLMGDLAALFGKAVISDEKHADIVIAIDDSLTHDEEYKYTVTDKKIYLTGKGDLGTMWAVYSFLEKELKVPPFYKFEGLELESINGMTIENKTVSEYPKTRFRGWFINDEDLLTAFKWEGHRDIDYQFYKNVISEDMINLIAETALRYRMNLIIPSTLVDITNPYEKRLLDVCSRRGLYLSQHHIEPLGVSRYGFSKFARENNLSDGFSYVSNKDALAACWKKYAEMWSVYPRVVWQLGLRGGTDRPVWDTDKNVGTSSKERGELISGAMKTQYDIIRSVYKHNLHFTSTLWMEGAALLKSGDINLPDDVIIVFSDVGMSQMFGNDIYEVNRKPGVNYGVYYHSGYWHTGPHLAEGVLPEKMVYSYDVLRKTGTSYYSMMNVANIKELTFSIYINSNLLWQDSLNLDGIYENYTKLYTDDNEKLIKAIKDYYACMADVGEKEYEKFCHKYNFDYRKYENLPFPVVSMNDGMIRSITFLPMNEKRERTTPEIKAAVELGMKNMPKVYGEFQEIRNSLKESYQEGFASHWVFESYYWVNLFNYGGSYYKAIEALNAGDKDKCVFYYQDAHRYLDNIIGERDNYFMNEWKGWQDGDEKINIKYLHNVLNEEAEKYGRN